MEKDVIKMSKCDKCRCSSLELCEGQYAIKGSLLVICPSFIDYRSKGIIEDNLKVPFPKMKKKNKKNKRGE